jgi:hypothetical protein
VADDDVVRIHPQCVVFQTNAAAGSGLSGDGDAGLVDR